MSMNLGVGGGGGGRIPFLLFFRKSCFISLKEIIFINCLLSYANFYLHSYVEKDFNTTKMNCLTFMLMSEWSFIFKDERNE